MYFSRGNPVVYYGDEQGFTGDGGDQVARQIDVREPRPGVPGRRPARHRPDRRRRQLRHRLRRSTCDQQLAEVTGDRPALRDGAEQVRYASTGPGVFAFSRIDRKHQKEYVVALNNSESAASADVPTFIRKGRFHKVYGAGPASLTTHGDRTLPVSLPAACPRRSTCRTAASRARTPRRDDRPGSADAGERCRTAGCTSRRTCKGDSFYEVTFQRKVGHGSWKTIGVDDSAPYQVYDDVSSLAPGSRRLLPRGRAGQRRPHQRGIGCRGARRCRGPTVTMTERRSRGATCAATSTPSR